MGLYPAMLWIFLVLVVVDGAPSGQIRSPGNFSLSVNSQRNSTGHWIITMDALRRDYKQDLPYSYPRELSVDVDHSTTSSNDTVATRLTSRAILLSPALEDLPLSVIQRISVENCTRLPPTGYEVFADLGFYKSHVNPLTWDEARDKCVEEGAHLMIINSKLEAEVASKIVNRDQSKVEGAQYQYHFWLGYDERNTQAGFITVLGDPLSSSGYLEWYSGYPDVNPNWVCGGTYTDGKLFDFPCAWKLPFICELKAS